MPIRAFFVVLCALLVARSLAYSPAAAASESDSLCGSSPGGCPDHGGPDGHGCCTDLVNAAIQAGGYTGPTSRGAAVLAADLVASGWSSTDCTGSSECTPGDVLFYPNMNRGHVAMCSSNGLRNQWNPPNCDASVDWSTSGGLKCLSPPQSRRANHSEPLKPLFPAKPTEELTHCITQKALNAAVSHAVEAAVASHSVKMLQSMQLMKKAGDCNYITCGAVVLQCVNACQNGVTPACQSCVGPAWSQCCGCFNAC